MMNVVVKGTGWDFPARYHSSESGQSINDDSIISMVYGAVQECLEDADVSMADVDAVVTASVDLLDGKTASNISITEVVGAVMKPETRIAGDGLFALAHAAMTIMSGQYDKVLVVAHGKASETDYEKFSNWTYDPMFQQPLGMTDSIALGLQAQTFLSRLPESMAGKKVRAELLESILDNDLDTQGAKDKSQTPMEERLNGSQINFSPLHDLEITVLGDGASAVLLQAGDKGKASLQGFGYSIDSHYLGDRDLGSSPTLGEAAERALKMAGISNIKEQINHYYWSLRSSIQLPLWAESAGAWSFDENLDTLFKTLDSGFDRQDENHPGFNTWKNLPPIAMGLQRLICAVKDIEKGKAQGNVFIQGSHGPAGQTQSVCIIK